ncbi:hypothetical protein [Methylobacter luteus]|nr:hypothetical protein [Methylobacter luteus]
MAVLWGVPAVGDAAPAGHRQTLTLIAGLRADRLTTPWCLD